MKYAKWFVDRNTVIISLGPGDKLIKSLKYISQSLGFNTASIVCGIGSFSSVVYQYGGVDFKLKQNLEILSISGTIVDGMPHIHVTMIDFDGNVTGGHLYEGTIYTIGEITLQKTNLNLFRKQRDGSEFDLISD